MLQTVFLILLFSGVAHTAGLADSVYCIGKRKFIEKGSPTQFDFRPRGFSLPNAYWLAVASNNVYREKDAVLNEFKRWGFVEGKEPQDDNKLFFLDRAKDLGAFSADTQAVWAENRDGIILVFRGTTPENAADLATDRARSREPLRDLGEVHAGFLGALKIVWGDIDRRMAQLRRRERNEQGMRYQKPIWISGHSLGAAIATIAAAKLLKEGFNVAGLYTFGSPRADTEAFAHAVELMAHDRGMREQLVRFVNQHDIVARIPPFTGLTAELPLKEEWRHVGRVKYFTGKKPESGSVELNTDPLFTVGLPQFPTELLDKRDDWFRDHNVAEYIRKLEHVVFGAPARCD
ncbi:MAG: hypothetical protein HYR96_04085 [Deltaproteobacteria bacterium]|nr:hypothetical protein [Deltaproteobacteria bacterium]MBI3295303.1 hypothetical protein [Deltaproteobacteria bacterium]